MKKLGNYIGKIICQISPVLASKFWFFIYFRRKLDLKRPKTLDEKLMWLKLNKYWHNPLVTQGADKYYVRDYIKDVGCEELLNEIYGVWETAEDIEWEKLPNSFVLKCNHGCGYNVICSDKSRLDIDATKKLLDKWLKEEFWKKRAEVQYQDIQPKIICEAFLKDEDGLADYKIYCFNGKAEYILFCKEREKGKTKFYFFDTEWNLCPINKDSKQVTKDFWIERPMKLKEMINYAEHLSEPFPFVRVDFYYIENKIIFGEMTFVPSAALDTSRLPETDLMFGEKLELGK